ncbi:DUF1127 domain-containing protein [Roseovarius nanhaiticus]|uniref:DUF1127 domain-containing protein n=2 Tax=Roseovarius nanhaiticus TaxID=573024 RepID=UPI00267B374C
MTSLVHARPAASRNWPSLSSLAALYRSRRALAALDGAALADIGLTRAEADAEARRPLWDLPHAWQPRAKCRFAGSALPQVKHRAADAASIRAARRRKSEAEKP